MKLDFSRAAFIAALIDILIMIAASTLTNTLPEIWTDAPMRDVQAIA